MTKIDNEPIIQFIESIHKKRTNPTNIYSGSRVISKITLDEDSEQTVLVIEGNVEIDSLVFHCSNHELYILTDGHVSITNNSYIRGPIVIMSEKSILVGMQSQLCNVILAAKDSVLVASNSLFKGQIICGGEIIIKDDAKVEYPSLLYVHDLDDVNIGREIALKNKSKVSAVAVLALTDNTNTEFTNKIYVDTLVVASGIVWSSAYSDIRGKIYGTSVTKEYWYERRPTTYINWLKNATIDRQRLDFLTILPITINQDNKYAVFEIQE